MLSIATMKLHLGHIGYAAADNCVIVCLGYVGTILFIRIIFQDTDYGGTIAGVERASFPASSF